MNSYTPLIGRTLKFLAPQQRQHPETGKIEHRQFEMTGKVREVSDAFRTVLIDEETHRWEDVTPLEVDGQPYLEWLKPAPVAKVAVTRWNPRTKTVLNHETGVIDIDATNETRNKLGMQVPWTQAIGQREYEMPPLMLPEEEKEKKTTDDGGQTTEAEPGRAPIMRGLPMEKLRFAPSLPSLP